MQAPPRGQMTFFGFIEAMLALLPKSSISASSLLELLQRINDTAPTAGQPSSQCSASQAAGEKRSIPRPSVRIQKGQ